MADGTLDAGHMRELLKRVRSDRAYWTFVEVADSVLTAAETLVATHPIRTLDAIHVASAQLFATRLATPGFVFVSADPRQTHTATAIGLTVRPIAH